MAGDLWGVGSWTDGLSDGNVVGTDPLNNNVLDTDTLNIEGVDLLSTDFLNPDGLRESSCDIPYIRTPLFINPQDRTSETSFLRSEGFPNASSSTFGSQSLNSGYPQVS